MSVNSLKIDRPLNAVEGRKKQKLNSMNFKRREAVKLKALE